MSAANFPAGLKFVLQYEGGFSDNPADPGGATNLGVTYRTLAAWDGGSCTIADVEALTPDTVAPIYHTNFWNACRCDALPSGVDVAVFDGAVNSGPGRAAKWLQGAAGVVQDGIIGPASLAAVMTVSPSTLIGRILNARLAFDRADPDFATFGDGWTRRVAALETFADSLLT